MSTDETQGRAVVRHYDNVSMAPTFGGGGSLPALQSLADVVSIAQLMAKAGVAVPKHLRDNPGACLSVTMQALRWEFDPFAVANKSYAVNDRLAYEAQLINAVVLTRAPVKYEPDYVYEGEGPTRKCTVTFDMVSGKTLSYTTPEIGQIKTQNSPLWKSDPDQQLSYFAIRSWARRHTPQVILGVYDREEIINSEVVSDEPATSGIMARLSGDQAGAGFDHGSVIEQTEKPKRARKPKDEPAPEIEAAVEPEPEQATAAEEEDDGQPVEDGHAAPGEIYIHTEDTVETTDGRYMTFRDGARFSSTAEPLKFKVYAQHAPEIVEEEERPTTAAESTETGGARPAEPELDTSEPATDASDDGQPQEEDSGQSAALESDTEGLPPELAAYVSQIDTCKSWADAKTVMQQFYATDFFKGLKDFTKNEIRAQTWTTLKEVGVKTPDPISDISAFRLFIEAVDDIEAISGAFTFLKKDQDAKFSEKAPATQAAIADAVADRIATLRGA